MRNIRVAERSAWVTAADLAAPTAAEPPPVRPRLRRPRIVKALLIAIALVGVPVVVSPGDSTVDAGGSCLRISSGLFNAYGSDPKNLNGEWVKVKNRCDRTVSLKGWKIRDVRGHTYRFPSRAKIKGGATVKIHTGKGQARAGHLYWGKSRPVWNNKAYERAYLIDRTGQRVSTWPVTERSFVLGVNINGPTVKVDGRTFRSHGTAQERGFDDGDPRRSENGVVVRPNPGESVARLLSDAAWRPDHWRFRQKLPDGTYQLFLYTMEDDSDYAHAFDVKIEGKVVGRDVGKLAAAKWKRWGPFESRVTDGTMTVDLEASVNSPHLMAFEIWKIKRPGKPKEPPPGSAAAKPDPTPTPKPTEAPEAAPTAEPTEAPTPEPTTAPTQAPTVAPTQAPTVAPTAAPTQAPTVAPSATPTRTPAPTPAPTAAPTQAPTAAPTQAPTATPPPTPSPTPAPTATPRPTPSPSPTPTATPRPTASPTPGPTASPTAPPAGGDAWATAFLSRPSSGAINRTSNCDNLVIENRTFKDLGANVEAIHLANCNNVIIRNNDFARVAQAITILDSTNVRIEGNRYQDILGPHERVGLHRANFIQLVRVSRGYIGHNKGKGGDTEDVISVYKSGGTSSSPLIVEYNHIEGTNWESTSGSGIALGDGGGSYTIARHNTLVNPGQVCMFIAGGVANRIEDNICIGEARPLSNVGIYVKNYSSGSCSGHTVARNLVRWYRADGVANHRWTNDSCGPISGWTSGTNTNVWGAVLAIADYRVRL